MRRPALFRIRDLTRAIKAAEKAGMKVQAVDILADGTIRVLRDDGKRITVDAEGGNPWDGK